MVSGGSQPTSRWASFSDGRSEVRRWGYFLVSARISSRVSWDSIEPGRLSIDLAHDRVGAGDHRDQVGDQPAHGHQRESLDVCERRGALVDADRLPGSVAYDVEAELAPRGL